MDKIFKRSKTVFFFLVLSVIVFLLIVIFSIIFICQENYIYLLILVIPFLLCIMFVIIAVIEHKGNLVLNDTAIIFNYRVFSGEKELNRMKISVAYSDIKRIKSELIKGDGIIAKDTTKYIFHLKNGRKFRTFFYQFSRNGEKEIVSLLSQVVNIE